MVFMFMTIFPLDANVWGTVAEWFGACLSGVAIIMVVWQTKETRKAEKDLLIYTNNLEKISSVRNSMDNLQFLVWNFLLSGDKNTDEIIKISKVFQLAKNEISFISIKSVSDSEVYDKLSELEYKLQKISIIQGKRFDCDNEEYAERIKHYEECMDAINYINDIFWKAQKELLNQTPN